VHFSVRHQWVLANKKAAQVSCFMFRMNGMS
jgi:hypothetical protein